MWPKSITVIESLDVESDSSSDISDYGMDVEDVELEMCSSVFRPPVVITGISGVKETRFDFEEHHARYQN